MPEAVPERMGRFLRIAVFLATLLLGACSTVQLGRDFDARAFETRVVRGATTQEQVRTWLGAPMGTGASVNGGGERFDEWTYYFATGRLPDMSGARLKMLQIRFDRQGVVRGYNWSASGQ